MIVEHFDPDDVHQGETLRYLVERTPVGQWPTVDLTVSDELIEVAYKLARADNTAVGYWLAMVLIELANLHDRRDATTGERDKLTDPRPAGVADDPGHPSK